MRRPWCLRKPFYFFTIEEMLEPKSVSYIKPPVDPAEGCEMSFGH
jgi:hypothetical protein